MNATDLKPENNTDIEVESAQIDLDELRRRFDTEARTRTLSGWQYKLVLIVAIALSLFHFYTSGFGLLLAIKQRAFHLALVLLLVYMLYPASGKSRKDSIPWYDFILGGIAAYVVLYHVIYFDYIVMRAGLPTSMDLTVGFLGIILLLEATRRVSNPILPCIAIFFLLYCYFGRSFPAMFAHRGFSIQRIINHMYMGTEGVFGIP
jgi:TRAP-type uncharacterized transport system fused permease subunit